MAGVTSDLHQPVSGPDVVSDPLVDRHLRQQGLLPAARLRECAVTIIGVGAIGRQAAIQLATIGVGTLTLIDPDQVEVVNLGAQGYFEEDLGRAKVDATAGLIRRINRNCAVHVHQRRFCTNEDAAAAVVFCCVDSIETRRQIFQALKGSVQVLVDGRMSAESLRILCISDAASSRHYSTTLFTAAEAYRGACTARSTFYAASLAAGLMTGCLARWLRGIHPPADMSFNLLADELVVAELGQPLKSI